MNMDAKKNVIMRLIAMMDDDMSEKLSPEKSVGVTKIEIKPDALGETLKDEKDENETDSNDEDIMEFLKPEQKNENDLSELDRFKKKYQKA